jgi:tetratricopeptide (TPR) repeat protein
MSATYSKRRMGHGHIVRSVEASSLPPFHGGRTGRGRSELRTPPPSPVERRREQSEEGRGMPRPYDYDVVETMRRLMRTLFAAIALAIAACSSTPKVESKADPSTATSVAKQATLAPTSTPASMSSGQTATQPPTAVAVPAEAQQKFAAAMQLVSAGKQDEAALQLERLAADYPTLATPLINVGLLYLKANQFEAARHAFERALQRDAKSAPADNYLGVCYRNLGKFKEAQVAYQAALASDEAYAPAHLNLGVLYDLYLQQPEQALTEYERYQQLLPTPDTKIASWIKELKSRLGSKAKAASGNAASASGEKTP